MSLPMVSEMLISMQAQPFKEVLESICAHHGAVDADVCLPVLKEGLIEAGIQLPGGTSPLTIPWSRLSELACAIVQHQSL